MRLKNFLLLLALIFTICFLLAGNGYGARLSEGKEVASPPQKTVRPDPSVTKVKPESSTETKNTKSSGNEDTLVTMNMDNMDISFLAKLISDLTGKTFLVDPKVKGKVTIISATPQTVGAAYKAFESALELNNLTLVPSGNVIKIVQDNDAISKNIETRFGDAWIDPEDRIITQIIPLKYASPTDISRALAKFSPKGLVPYDQTGMLIVTDTKSNISHLLEILKRIDIPGTGEEISVIPLKQASAQTMATSLGTVFRTITGTAKKATQAATQITIVPDERTNSLIVVASEVDTLKIKELINLLDKETEGEGDIHVINLQNSVAEDLANTLNGIRTTDTRQAGQQGGAAPVITKDTQINFDKATNALIITAQKDQYEILKNVIKQLDRPRSQVYIEALVMEVSMKKDFQIGVQWQAGKQGDSATVYSASNPGVNNFPSVDTTTGDVSLPTGWSSGIIGDTITIGGVDFTDLGAVFRAYRNDSDVQIFSNPSVMAMNNQEADLSVTDNVPYLTREVEGSSGTGYANYDRMDVGVKLKITPQINQERFILLKIEQEVSQISSTNEAGQPTTFKRNVNTTVRIKDGQTVVIGGLIDTKDDRTNYRVPLLGRIPILGVLFRSKTTLADKKNMYLFVTPRIIENMDEANEIYENKKGHIDTIKQGVIKMHNDGKQSEDMRRVELGYKYFQLKDYEKALKYYRKALDKNPGNAYAIYNIGYIYQIEGENEKAIEMYERLIALDPPDRAVESSDYLQVGRKLTDMAKYNLKSLKADK